MFTKYPLSQHICKLRSSVIYLCSIIFMPTNYFLLVQVLFALNKMVGSSDLFLAQALLSQWDLERPRVNGNQFESYLLEWSMYACLFNLLKKIYKTLSNSIYDLK